MKVLTLQGGARKKGNTATVLAWVEEELKAMGHEVETVHLQNKNIKGCLACGKCKENPGAVACIQKDDAIEILDKMVEAELVIFTSPLYFWGVAGPLKSLIDRTYSFYVDYHRPTHASLVKNQRQALLVTGAGPWENNAEATFTAFERLQGPHMAIPAGNLYIGKCTTPENLDENAKDQAKAFAQKIVS
ncbi:Multimeric flavodoxin WrbA [Desulfocicer vacuolatum DSM 3385]|uniref:Multimeric flavodoxin WrbA n=1 Tax=Desulfocicer vacuolatum DSM 3385 TaxID=1121400 RepID=A0A1W2EGU7_9BACT|nr:flavodoxin family protein [Desulfocicer vacuolatum]SMD08662.1 Multimeric flavodoxin WrbA [Desulfocicer vacuolatum DSM 3385]